MSYHQRIMNIPTEVERTAKYPPGGVTRAAYMVGHRDARHAAAEIAAEADAEVERLSVDLAAARAERDGLAKVLAWYGEQTRLARLIHSEGDSGRRALDADGGARARAALAALPTKEADDA